MTGKWNAIIRCDRLEHIDGLIEGEASVSQKLGKFHCRSVYGYQNNIEMYISSIKHLQLHFHFDSLLGHKAVY